MVHFDLKSIKFFVTVYFGMKDLENVGGTQGHRGYPWEQPVADKSE